MNITLPDIFCTVCTQYNYTAFHMHKSMQSYETSVLIKDVYGQVYN